MLVGSSRCCGRAACRLQTRGWFWKRILSSPLPPCRQLLDCDQELYKNFPLVISERWQQEVAETVFEAVNGDTDKVEMRKRAKNKQLGHEEGTPSPTPKTQVLPPSVGRVGH